MLSGDCCCGAVAASGYQLAGGLGAKVTGDEESGNARPHLEVHEGVAARVQFDEAVKQAVVRVLADEDEDCRGNEFLDFICLDVPHTDPGH